MSVKASIMAPSFLEGIAHTRMAFRSYTYATKIYCIDQKERTGKAPGRSVYMVPVVRSTRAVKQMMSWAVHISLVGRSSSTWRRASRSNGWLKGAHGAGALSVAAHVALVGGGGEQQMAADKTRCETGNSGQFLAVFKCPQ